MSAILTISSAMICTLASSFTVTVPLETVDHASSSTLRYTKPKETGKKILQHTEELLFLVRRLENADNACGKHVLDGRGDNQQEADTNQASSTRRQGRGSGEYLRNRQVRLQRSLQATPRPRMRQAQPKSPVVAGTLTCATATSL